MSPVRIWLVAAVLGLALALGLGSVAVGQGAGILEGTVVNGTPGGPAVGAGLPVKLHVLQGDGELKVLETTTDVSGVFRFEGLDTDATLAYVPEVVYLEVPYRGDALGFGAGQTSLAATLPVYETSTDDSTIRLDSVHMIAESFGQVLRITEIHLFGNSGDRTYIGANGTGNISETLFIPLPENAVGLAFGEDTPADRFVEVEGGLLDTQPVPPGQEASLAFFSYHLPVSGETVPLERRFAYPVTALNVLVAQPGLNLQSSQLASMGPESFQGRQYQFYGVENLAVDAPLSMEFIPVDEADGGQAMGGAPSTAGESADSVPIMSQQGLLRWLGWGLALLAVVGAVVYALTTRRPATTPGARPNLSADPKARRLLLELAELEEAYAAGQVEEAAYERQRTDLYEAIKSL